MGETTVRNTAAYDGQRNSRCETAAPGGATIPSPSPRGVLFRGRDQASGKTIRQLLNIRSSAPADVARRVLKCVPIVFRLAAHVLVLAAVVSPAGCGNSPTAPDASELCTGYPDWQTSAYVLPYAVGATFRVSQANCSPPVDGHRGSERYAYDFDMPIGTPLRRGTRGCRRAHRDVSC
jgi:hypothetical protein